GHAGQARRATREASGLAGLDQSENRKFSRSCLFVALRLLKLVTEVAALLPWRVIAAVAVRLAPSCMNRVRTPMPHSGAVRIWLRVLWPPFWTMPSPVLTSWSRKSLNGWMFL